MVPPLPSPPASVRRDEVICLPRFAVEQLCGAAQGPTKQKALIPNQGLADAEIYLLPYGEVAQG